MIKKLSRLPYGAPDASVLAATQEQCILSASQAGDTLTDMGPVVIGDEPFFTQLL